MADWKQQYLAALTARDEVEKANLALYDHYSKLADQKAALAKLHLPDETTSNAAPLSSPPTPVAGYAIRRIASPQNVSESSSLTQMRQDLAKAQQQRGDLQGRLDAALRELETSKTQSRSDRKRMAQVTATVSQMTVKLRDREEELRGKAKLLEDVQDENVTLTLQLNMSEQRADKLKKENEELVNRWMTRMGKEADRMNDESKFG